MNDDDWIRQEDLASFFSCSRSTLFKVYLKHPLCPTPVAERPRRYLVAEMRNFRRLLELTPEPGDTPTEVRPVVGNTEQIRERVKAVVAALLLNCARQKKVISFYAFAAQLTKAAGEQALGVWSEVLDEIDTDRFGADRLLPSVLIQEGGKPLERADRVASALGLSLSGRVVQSHRERLFLSTLAPTDRRPIAFRWYHMGCQDVMSAVYERPARAAEAPVSPEYAAYSAQVRANYTNLVVQ